MANFFHHFRQRLLYENRLKKYLLYAVGEIILVVIGILVAIQINNWNESNKEGEIGTGYLARIKTDLEKDTLYLSQKILKSLKEQETLKLFVKSMYEEQSNTEDFTKLISSVHWDRTNLIIEDKSYVEITNSGKFGYIKNQNIRNRIMDFYRKYAITNQHISEMNDTGGEMFTKGIYQRLIEYYDVFEFLSEGENMVDNQNWKFINNPNSNEFKDLKAVALFYYYKQTVDENYYKELNTDAKELIQEIESEIALN